MKTFGSLYTGGDLAGIGARAAGFDSIWGNEIDPRIAEVATANGSNGIVVGDVLKLDPHRFERPDWFHASPVCTRASVANQSAELNDEGLRESPLDIAMAEKVAEFIRYLKPQCVTIENVQGYKHFKSFKLLIRALSDCGYMYDVQVINFADMGVPQTRRRLIVRAVLGGFVPYLPPPVPWIGWYAAIEDIIDTLPESQFAEWQLARLPEFINVATLFHPQKRGENLIFAAQEAPSNTITSSSNQKCIKAFLFGDQQGQVATPQDPAFTVRAGENGGAAPRAFLFPGGGNTNFAEAHPGKGARFENEPSHVVSTLDSGGTMPRAFIVDGENGGRQTTIRDCSLPMYTISSSQKGAHRAFLVDGQSSKSVSGLQVLQAADPAQTVTASVSKHPSRAWLSQGRVVKMTVQALGRFQSVPDWYVGLTAKICGNGCPPLGFEVIGKCWQ